MCPWKLGHKFVIRGLYLSGFIGGTRVMWFKDTGDALSILSFKIYNSLPASAPSSAIALADGQQAKTNGLGHVVLHLGTKEL